MKRRRDNKADPMSSVSEIFSFIDTPTAKAFFLLGFIGAIGNGLVFPAIAYIFSNSFSSLSSNSIEEIKNIGLRFVGIGAYAFVVGCIQNVSFQIVAKLATRSFRQQWFYALLRQDAAFYDVYDISGYAATMSANAQHIQHGLGMKFGEGIQYMVTGFGGVAYALWVSWRVALVVLAVLPFISISILVVMKANQTQTSSATKAYATAGSVAYQTVSSIKTVFALNAVPKMIEMYANATKEAYDTSVKPLLRLGFANGVMRGSFLALFGTLTLYGTSLIYMEVRKSGCDPTDQVSDNESCTSTGSDVFGAMLGVAFAAQGFSQLADFLEAFTAARTACYPAIQAIRRTVGSSLGAEKELSIEKKTDMTSNDFLDEETGVSTMKIRLPKYEINTFSDDGIKPDISGGKISFEDVCFSYPTRPNNLIYEGFSLNIDAKTTVALVGPSGGGKSTAISLIERFYDPISGRLTVDGVDIRDINLRHWRNQIGLVNQEPTLFATSISENISCGREGATQDEIEAAARMANAHNFIMSFPDGYNTQVGDKGTQLSGGQKQRIAIARVLIKNPKILILDEATSALDSESELIVQESLDQLLVGGRRTTIVIAHRLTTIRKADKIAVIADGKVVEFGTHDELMESSQGHYKSLVEKQYSVGDANRVGDNISNSMISNSVILPSLEKSCLIPSFGDSQDVDAIISFNSVTFAYPTRPLKTIFSNFSMKVKRGETLALVGPSGGGKSTTVSLIERFYDPLSGSVSFEGVDMRDLNVRWLRNQIGYVGQEPVLFNDTIANNIAYGSPGSTREDVEKAARLANAHDFIMSFSSCYDTPVGERGTQLSGGQKQRIAIARALVKNPKVLILDEATSALDSHSEAVVQQALDNLMASNERTTIVIAHRLSTIRNASRIAFIGGGQVKESGTHQELMQISNGRYRRLVETQMRDSQIDLISLKDLLYGNKENDYDDADGDTEPDKEEGKYKHYMARIRSMAFDDWRSLLVGCCGAILAGAMYPAWGVLFGLLINVLFTPVLYCADPSIFNVSTCEEYWSSVANNMKQTTFKLAAGWSAVVAASIIGWTLVFVGFGRASESLNKKIRDLAFTSLCRQDVAYFDKRSVGGITSQLQDDTAKIHGLTGQPIRILIMNLTSVAAGVIVSLAFMWPVALVLFALAPILAIAAKIRMRSILGTDQGISVTSNDRKSAGGIAMETLLNIKTVSSLNLEKQRYDEFSVAVASEYGKIFISSLKSGSTNGFGILIQQWVNAVALTWGGWLLIRYPNKFLYQDFLISMMSLILSLFGVGSASIGAVDKKAAEDAAKRIFDIVNRESPIDSMSDKGVILDPTDCVDGSRKRSD